MQTRGYLNKQASLLLQKPVYAWIMIGVFAVFPFTGWLALAAMALVALRGDWFDGLRCLIVGLTVSMCYAELVGRLPEVLDTVFPVYLLCYGSACLLRRSASWQLVAIFIVSLAVSIVLWTHWFATDFLLAQYQSLLQVINAIDHEHVISQVFNDQSMASQFKWAHYLFGIKMVSVILSAMVPLLLARSVQSALYYPGAFKKEMVNFRAERLACLFLLVTIWGASQNNLLAISCLPILFAYLMMAGVSLVLNLLAKKKNLVVYATLFLPMVLLPYFVLPAYVLFGSIDSVFNLRSRWRLHTHSD